MSESKALSIDSLHRVGRETFVRRLEFHDEIRSTNDRAMELATATDLQTPLLVVAAQQTAGRGRGANRWWSGRGALTFSLVLAWDAERSPLGAPGGAGTWPQLSLAAALAVTEVVGEVIQASGASLPYGIRWPNDVHVGGKKICGILPELPKGGCQLVLGVGLNVNNRLADAPPEIQAVGTSLCEHVGRPLDPTDVLAKVLKGIERNLAALERSDPWLAEQWMRYCLLSGKTVELELGPRRVRGLCRGIAPDGALLLHHSGATERHYGGVIVSVS